MDHTRVINRIRSVSDIIHTLLCVVVWQKVQIHPDVASNSNNGESIYIYKSVKKPKSIRRYTESLSLYTSVPIVHWENNIWSHPYFYYRQENEHPNFLLDARLDLNFSLVWILDWNVVHTKLTHSLKICVK